MANIGFENKEVKTIKTPLVEENFTNAICFGKTGSGKTTGYILPNIENRIKLGHGILVYDFKGNIHEQVKVLAQKHGKLDDVIEVGKPWAKKINILKHTNSKIVRQMYQTVAGSHSDSYWEQSSSNLLDKVYNIISSFESISLEIKDFPKRLKFLKNPQLDYTLNIKSIFMVIKSALSLSDFIEYQVDSDTLEVDEGLSLWVNDPIVDENPQLEESLKKIAYHNKKIKENLAGLSEYRGLNGDTNESTGKFAVLGVLNSILSHSALNDIINEDEVDIVDALNNKKIVILNLGNVDESILGLLNISIYQRLQRRVISNQSLTPVSIFIDEAQKILYENYLPEVDVCRESKFEYILSTQDELLLHNKIGIYKMVELMRNIVMQISFASNNEYNDTQKLKQDQYKDLITQKKSYTKPLYLEQKDLFNCEYNFQKKNNYFDSIKEKYRMKYIVVYIPEIYDQGKVLIKFKNGTTKTVNISYNDDLLDMFRKPKEKDFKQDTQNIIEESNTVEENKLNTDSRYEIIKMLNKLNDKIDSFEEKLKNHRVATITCIKKTENLEEKFKSIKNNIEDLRKETKNEFI